MQTINKPDLNRLGNAPYSKIDLFSGKHTTSFIVAILFVITFMGLILVICIKDPVPDVLVTGIIGLLGMLGGFFAGSNIKKEA